MTALHCANDVFKATDIEKTTLLSAQLLSYSHSRIGFTTAYKRYGPSIVLCARWLITVGKVIL